MIPHQINKTLKAKKATRDNGGCGCVLLSSPSPTLKEMADQSHDLQVENNLEQIVRALPAEAFGLVHLMFTRLDPELSTALFSSSISRLRIEIRYSINTFFIESHSYEIRLGDTFIYSVSEHLGCHGCWKENAKIASTETTKTGSYVVTCRPCRQDCGQSEIWTDRVRTAKYVRHKRHVYGLAQMTDARAWFVEATLLLADADRKPRDASHDDQQRRRQRKKKILTLPKTPSFTFPRESSAELGKFWTGGGNAERQFPRFRQIIHHSFDTRGMPLTMLTAIYGPTNHCCLGVFLIIVIELFQCLFPVLIQQS